MTNTVSSASEDRTKETTATAGDWTFKTYRAEWQVQRGSVDQYGSNFVPFLSDAFPTREAAVAFLPTVATESQYVKGMWIPNNPPHDYCETRIAYREVEVSSPGLRYERLMGELLPCPFCGGDGVMMSEEVAYSDMYYVTCGNGNCLICDVTTILREDKEDAARDWNARAPAEVSDKRQDKIIADETKATRTYLNEMIGD